MPVSEEYRRQAVLLVRAIPLVAEETCFALKGGTAINLFVRDMPRLSVDIDLTYLLADLVGRMPEEHRRFLISFEKGEPEWGLLDIPHAKQLPAVQWRLYNLAKIDTKKREQLVEDLRRALQVAE